MAAASTAPPLTTTNTTTMTANQQHNMFEDDDEDTWSLLLSLASDSPDISSRLQSLGQRLQEDFKNDAPSTDFWEGLCKNVQGLGFTYSTQPLKTTNAPAGGSGSSNDYPAAFKTEGGKKHIKAVSTLLGITELRSVKITMSALRSVNGEGSNFHSLLGSRDLLMKTMLHHFHQRSARISVVTECLRLEQDENASQRESIQRFLDSIDSTFQDGDGHDRGLYRRLLTISCAPEIIPTRDQLEPCKELHESSPLSLLDAIHTPQGEQGWISFVKTCLEELRKQTGRERAEAMEALLVLLYERIKGGVRRPDYALLLTAFKSSSDFFTENIENSRLSILAGLICAESMALWRVFSQDVDPRIGWVAGHPFLEGMQNSSQAAQMEINSLQLLLENAAEALPQRQANSMTNENNSPAPESLALLAFGLLLHLASATTNGWHDASSKSGMEIAIASNDKYGVFDYMSSIIHTLTDDFSKVSSTIAHDQPYDWQFSNLSKPLLLENQSETEAGADTLSYTSIAKEVLAATIATFGSQILSSRENITMLSNLAYLLFQNNTLLCDQVWGEWETCSSADTVSTAEFPFWGLMDASYKLAVEGHEAFKRREFRASEEFVSNAAPFLRLAASLSHEPEVVEKTMSALPEGLIRDALICCRSETPPSQEAYQKSKVVLLESLSSLTRTGNSETCLEFLRMQLEGNTREHAILDGPRVLGRILSARVTSEEANPVLQMTAHLLQGAPQRWVLQLAQEIMVTEDTNYGLAALMAPGRDATHSAALVLAELIEHFTAVIFCDSFIEGSAVTFLQLLANGIASAISTLASSLSAGTSTLAGRTSLSFETAQTILQGFADFLIGIRAVCKIHRSESVRTTAIGIRDNLIKALASSTSWGNAIAYYAVAPVSLTLLIRLQDAVGDQKILEASQSAGNKENDANMGPWQSILNNSNQGASGKVARASLLQFVEKMSLEDFDLEGIRARGWANESDEAAPINAAWSAIRLLSSWASHVEDIVQSHWDGSDFFESMPTDTETKALVDALSPQRLLTSLASSPIPCRESSILSSTWNEVGLSHFDLLLPYLSQAEDRSGPAISAPASATLDFLQACVAHVLSSCPPETVADSILFRAIYRSNRFYKLVKTMIERSITRSKEANLTASQKTEVCNGLLSLRIVASCAEASASVADKLLHLDTAAASLVPVLVDAASDGLTILAAADGSRNIFESDVSVMKLRVALGCLEVISALWKTAFRSLQVREDSVRSRLCKVVEEQGSLIMKLVQVVSLYGTGNLDASVVPSWTSEHARCTMVLFVSTAFDVLTTELEYSVCAPGVRVNDALKNLLLADFLRCERFASYDGYRYAAEVSSSIQSTGIHSRIDGYHLGNVLKCYPSTSSHYMLKDFYRNENSFDVSASMQLLTTMGIISIGDVKDVVPKMAISYQTTLCELHMMNSWKKFAESISIFFSGHPDVETPKSSQSKERLFDFAQVTMATLRRNVIEVAKSHGESTKGFMKNECVQMATLLSRLFLFFLELSVDGNGASFSPQTASLLSLLDDVIATSDTVFSLIAADATSGDATQEVLETCCKLQSSLLASAVVILAISESKVSSSVDEFRTRRDSLYNSICRANGRVLGVLVDILKGTKKDADVLSLSPENLDLLRCCIVLSTAIVARAQGPGLIETNYYHVVAESLQEYEVLSRLLQLGISSSRLAVTSHEKNKDSKPSKSFLAHIDIVLSILSLLYSVAETNDRKMLGVLPKYLLAQFLSRNPLFSFAATNWERSDESDATRKRGYIVLDGSSFIGINDPMHEVLLATLTFLQAALRASSCRLNAQSTESSSMFIDISVEFLRTYRKPLLACLKSTGTKLRRNALLEASHTLSLVAELGKRDVRDSVLLANRDLFEEFVNWTKFAVVNISKFLSATGTSRELFLAIADYESSESEEITDERLSSLRLKHRHPLLSEGLPRATSEAVKNSHDAQRLCEQVTESDFKDATTVPDYLKNLAKDREQESDLERNCRLFVICNFAIEMEQASAGCLSQAISLIWRLHPASFAFRTFSEVEIQNMDAMSIVRPGVIIGFRPRAGEGALSEYQPGSNLFKSLRFGRVQSSNTISRTWEVVLLHRGEAETHGQDTLEIVNVRQLAGIEDASMRHPVTLYRPAPMDVSFLGGNNGVLTVGALIIILRWCHQESLSKSESNQASEHGAIRRVAEQTVALLGAELALHEEIGSSIHLSKADRSRLDTQIFELFADDDILSTSDNAENPLPVRYNTTGRLKHIVDDSVLLAVRPQIEPSVKRAWQEIQEKERRRREKRTFSHDTSWFSNSVHKKGGFGRKSAFRGLG